MLNLVPTLYLLRAKLVNNASASVHGALEGEGKETPAITLLFYPFLPSFRDQHLRLKKKQTNKQRKHNSILILISSFCFPYKRLPRMHSTA